MKKLTAVTGIAMVAALLWSSSTWSVRPCYADTGSIQTASLVPPPDRPKGPSTGMVGEKLSFKTSGHDPFDVHEYMFDWGDGSALKWKSSEKQSHVYQHEGTYNLRVCEKCPLEFFITDWSGKSQVTIAGNVADAWQLSVSSSPISGISISGDAPGKTNYSAPIPKGGQVTLTAPSSASVKGADYTFDRWVLGGVPQAEGVTDLSIQVDADTQAEATYNVVERDLIVQSDPVVGVCIAGLDGCTTNYSTTVPDNSRLKLTAPEVFDDGAACYGFTGWAGVGSKIQTKVRQSVRVTSDMTLTAMYGMIELAVLSPSDADIIVERGEKVPVEWAALNLPRSMSVQVLLVKGGTDVWTLSGGTKKSPLKWTVGKPFKGEEPYPDGDDYTIVVSALNGAVLAESANPFTIATVESLEIIGPTSVQGGTEPPQYTCIAHYTFGEDVDVTDSVKWKCDAKKFAKIDKTGLLATNPVLEEQPCTITATYGKGKLALTGGLDISVTP